jgi:hypothetical protein
VVDQPVVADDDVTVTIPVAGATDPTDSWPAAPASSDAPPPPTFSPPAVAPADGDGAGGGSRRRLLLGVAVVVVLAIIAGVLLLGGGGDEDLQARISKEIRSGGQSGLSEKEADCLAGELIDEVGADKLKDVDFSADEPPKAIADELNDAFVAAIPTCKIDLSDDDGTDATPGASTGGSTATTLNADQLDQFRDMLSQQYKDNLGLSDEKANCLANTMADAIERGELDENQSFESFFQYLTACDISVSELGGPAGTATG